jgi:hypothetical protein
LSVGEPATVFPIIAAALKDPSANVRQSACTVLQDLGPAGGPALSTLEEMIRTDADLVVRDSARMARSEVLRDLRRPAWVPSDLDDDAD